MKKLLFPVLALVLAVGLALPMAMPAATHTEEEPKEVDLIAGQTMDVGEVEVWNNETNLYVQYVVDSPWILTGSHLYVGKSDPAVIGMWSTPGQFPYSPGMEKSPSPGASYDEATMTYTIPLAEIYEYEFVGTGKGKGLNAVGDPGVGPCDDVYIGAHADVVRPIADCWETVWQIGDVESVITCDTWTGLSNYADEFNWGDPAGPCTPGPSLADDTPAYTDPFIVGTTPTDEFPFNSNSGRNYATEFDVQWSGDLLFGGELTISWSPGQSYPSETKEVSSDGISTTTFVRKGEPRLGEGWFLNTYPLYQDSVAVSPLSSGTHTINFKHTEGDGTYWDWVRLEKPCQQEETAWGEGTTFGTNWAMYFSYHIQATCVSGTVINGDFEFPVVTAPQGWNIYDSGTGGLGWTVEWHTNVPASWGGWIRPDPAHLELHRGVNGWLSYDGSQHAELDTDWDGPGGGLNNEPASVRIYQDIATCPGKTYTLTYAWSPRPGHNNNQLDVYWDGTLVTTHSGSGGSQTSWTLETWTGLSPSGTLTRLAFVETGTANSLGMFLDAVSLVEE